ncbi:MAG TPA: DUF5647 family protein [Candidatus Methylomirabilis sp.]|nr:DUF5647 family protein [Candidatus Methylomirabilis sp.]
MNVYEKRSAMLGVEFDRYVRDHSSFAARIPRRAQIVLQIPGETRFNTREKAPVTSWLVSDILRKPDCTCTFVSASSVC